MKGQNSRSGVALGGFEGAVFCGGTRQGIPGIVGDISADEDLSLFGYLPEHLPHDADKDQENYTLYFVGDKEFSFVQPLQKISRSPSAGICKIRCSIAVALKH